MLEEQRPDQTGLRKVFKQRMEPLRFQLFSRNLNNSITRETQIRRCRRSLSTYQKMMTFTDCQLVRMRLNTINKHSLMRSFNGTNTTKIFNLVVTLTKSIKLGAVKVSIKDSKFVIRLELFLLNWPRRERPKLRQHKSEPI